MKHISLLVYDEVMLTALSSSVALLNSANEAMAVHKRAIPFEIELVGVHVKNVQLGLPVQFSCSKTIDDSFQTDVIILPPMTAQPDGIQVFFKRYRPLLDWIKQKKTEVTTVISLCTGAYFLAEAGLLDGLPATSHWGAMNDLQARYPLVDFLPDKVVTTSPQIITGGGGFSALNALLFFIARECGKDIAVELSKYYGLDYGRTSQQLFMMFSGKRQHADAAIQQAQVLIEQLYQTEISVEKIAEQVNMSRRNFIRRFKTATSLNPIEYIQRVKIEAAKKSLEAGETSIAAVTFEAGYNDLKTFRAVFKKITGLTPTEYRNRYTAVL